MVEFFKGGDYGTDTQANIITLWGLVTTNARWATLRKTGATSGYQVTSGKTFYITNIQFFQGDGDGAARGCPIGYCDIDLGFNSASGGTGNNPVAIFGDPEASGLAGGGLFVNPTGNPGPWELEGFQMKAAPAGKFIYTRISSGGGFSTGNTVLVTGYEA